MDSSLPATAAATAAASVALPLSIPAAAVAVDISIEDSMDHIEISDKPDKVQIILDIILEAVNNKYNWKEIKLLLSKLKKFAGYRDMTLDDMRQIGIDAARSYRNFKNIKFNNSYNESTDQYYTSKDWNNKTGIHLRINESGNVIIRLSDINPMILDIISCMGPLYIEFVKFIPDVFPVLPDNVISVNIYINIRSQPFSTVIQQLPEFLRSFTCNITITNNFINMIPKTVEFLQIANASQYLDIYPMGLKTFIYSGNNYRLYYDDYENCISSFGILPYGMTKFSIDGVFAMPFSEVPPSVEFMYIRDLYETLINFPRGLKMLAIEKVYEPLFCSDKYFTTYFEGEINLKTNWEIDHDNGDYNCRCEKHKYYKWNPDIIMFNDGLECLALGRRKMINILLPKITQLPASFKKVIIPEKHKFEDLEISQVAASKYTTTIEQFQFRFPNIIIEYVNDFIDVYQTVNAY
jgi:hypothetical protein